MLEIANRGNGAARLKENEKDAIRLADTTGRMQSTNIISEPGFYRLVLRSDKPVADEFQTWVVRDVLPSIRKTGTYTVPTALPAPESAGAWAEAMLDMGFHRTPTRKTLAPLPLHPKVFSHSQRTTM